MKLRSTKLTTVIMLTAGMLLSSCSQEASKDDAGKNEKKLATVNYVPQGLLSKSLPEIADALSKREITSVALVQLYLNRIDTVDRNGPTLQAILTLNPNALADAKALDDMLAAGQVKGPLHGVPILLKDNIETKDAMPTTAGALALADNITGRDSPLVAGLREAGAVILGKTNLSQWANFRSDGSMSGWTALGGQVRNPHMLDRNPCGSSSGSGAAAAASLAAGTVGTETNGSVICPSNANGVVGFKPTVGIVPQDLIIPISATQDTAGPMTKTVKGAAMMMDAMSPAHTVGTFSKGLNKDGLKGIRVGVLRYAQGEFAPTLALFEAALKDIEAAGAILVDITEAPSTPEGYGKMTYDLLKYEFKHGLNAYLASTNAEHVKTRTLKDLIAFNQEHADIELALFDQSIFIASEAMNSLDDPDYKKTVDVVLKTNREDGVDKLLADHNVALLVAPSGAVSPRVDPINGDVWPNDWPGAGSMAARAGYPHATVPMGGINAISVGLSFIGGKNDDANILSYAYAYEQQSIKRLEPHYYTNAEELPEIAKAMKPYEGRKN